MYLVSYAYNLSCLKRSYSMSLTCPNTPNPSLEKQCCWAEPWCKQWSICSPPRRAVMHNMPCDCHNVPACGSAFSHLPRHWCKNVTRMWVWIHTVMNQPASASLYIYLSRVNERRFCLLPSETKLCTWFLYLFSCLSRHWEGRDMCMSFFLSPKRIESFILGGGNCKGQPPLLL